MKLLNYSGGIDSLFCLLFEDYDIVHHCSIINHEGRHRLEQKAVDATLGLVRVHLKKKFKYVHTTYDYGTVAKITKDMHLIGYQSGLMATSYGVTDVIVSSNKDDIANAGYWYPADEKRRAIANASAGKELNFHYPIAHLTKKELIEAIPEMYLKHAWFCRTPKNSKPCGKCITCNAVLPHLNKTR